MATIKYKNGNTWTQIVAKDVDAVSTTDTGQQEVHSFLKFTRGEGYPWIECPDIPQTIEFSTADQGANIAAVANNEEHNLATFYGGYRQATEPSEANKVYGGISAHEHNSGKENFIEVWVDPLANKMGYTLGSPEGFREALRIGRTTWLNNSGTNATISGSGYSTIANISFTGTGLWMLTGHVQFENSNSSAGRVYIGISDTQNYIADAAKGTSSLYAGQTNKSIVLNNSTFIYGSTTAQTYYLTCWVETGVTKVSNYQFSAVCLG